MCQPLSQNKSRFSLFSLRFRGYHVHRIYDPVIRWEEDQISWRSQKIGNDKRNKRKMRLHWPKRAKTAKFAVRNHEKTFGTGVASSHSSDHHRHHVIWFTTSHKVFGTVLCLSWGFWDVLKNNRNREGRGPEERMRDKESLVLWSDYMRIWGGEGRRRSVGLTQHHMMIQAVISM